MARAVDHYQPSMLGEQISYAAPELLESTNNLSLAATSELVNDLRYLGYLERRPDPSDERAKLIFPTPRGRTALDDAGDRAL